MKKIILSIAAVMAFGFANAQDISYGVKAGLNSSNVSDFDADSKIGIQLGGFAEIKINDKFAVQPELLYSMQGAKDDFSSMNMNYLNIPIMAKYFVTDAVSLQAGPQIGLLLSAEYDGTDVKDAFESTDFALNLGAGYNIGDNMSLDLRYNLGMSEVVKDYSGSDSHNNSSIQLSFGYKF